ncbi:MAG TPA: hypothetical protein VJY33_20130, partial [Isosphaeraceae bacterium]|nr:hypothetical protein [Isosphaeraceae bacterium]
LKWSFLASKLREQGTVPPRIWVVQLDRDRPEDPPNWSLAPLRSRRSVTAKGQEVLCRTALELHGQKTYRPPQRIRLEVDGKQVADINAPATARLDKGQVPLSFTHRFKEPGIHLISLILEVDPPVDQRPEGYVPRDTLPGDNRQDLAVEVVSALPVLLVDGDDRDDPSTGNPRSRGTDFLRKALAPENDPSPVVLAKVVPIHKFDPALLTSDLDRTLGTKPRVLVLSNVPRLSMPQQDAIARFVAEGGGLLITLGGRVEVQHYNDELYRSGQGWLPARLEEIRGSLDEPEKAVTPDRASFFHPAVDLFREMTTGGLADARFPRWHALSTPAKSSALVVAKLSNNDPLLVEKRYQKGRVILSAVPLDNGWRTNLPDLYAFVPLAHELIYYLAGARSAELNLQPGDPLVYRSCDGQLGGSIMIHPPQGEPQRVTIERNPLVYDGMRETGVYRIEDAGRVSYYVVQPDPQESQLAPCSAADRENVRKLIPLTYENDRAKLALAMVNTDERHELWWWFLIGVIVLLCGEVWLTRRIVMNR